MINQECAINDCTHQGEINKIIQTGPETFLTYCSAEHLAIGMKNVVVAKCQFCKMRLTPNEIKRVLAFSYANFYFCSDECADQYVE